MITATSAISEKTQRQLDMVAQSDGALEAVWLHGYLWRVKAAADDGVFIECKNLKLYKLPYRVTWDCSGDRKVNGEWRVVEYTRSRSFKHLSSALAFIQEF